MVDLLIDGGIIYTMNPVRTVIPQGAVAIKDNQITEVGSSDKLTSKYSDFKVIDARGKAVLPGFVNVHTHLPSIFVRGVYGVVREGLFQVLFPVKKYLRPEHCYTLGLASCIEALNSGSTTIQETYNYMEEFAKAAEKTGIRADVGEQIAEADYQAIKNGVYSYIPEQAEDMIRRALKLKKWHGGGEGRITVSWAPLAPDMSRSWVYKEVLKHHKQGEIISTHVEQSKREVEQVKKLYKKTSVEHLKDLEVLGPDTICAHCIYATDKDLSLLKNTGASILHCPRPYLLGGTTAPLARWLEKGIEVGLGTDNVYHTMWETMKAAVYASRIREGVGDPKCPSFYEILELATIKGAEVLGMEDKIGSLEPKKMADIQLINLKSPNITPTLDITSSLVLYGSSEIVDTIIVDGKILKQDGEMKVKDVEKSLEKAEESTEEIWGNLFKDKPKLSKLIKNQAN